MWITEHWGGCTLIRKDTDFFKTPGDLKPEIKCVLLDHWKVGVQLKDPIPGPVIEHFDNMRPISTKTKPMNTNRPDRTTKVIKKAERISGVLFAIMFAIGLIILLFCILTPTKP